jgi:hypothetical protein
MSTNDNIQAEQPKLEGPKPIAVMIPSHDIQALTAAKCSPYEYNQLILAKLKDAGAPVEGVINLKMAHGSVYKLKTNPMVEEPGFTYMWLPEAYVHALNAMGGVGGQA